MTCDETVMPQDMGMRQVFSMDAYGCSDITFGGVSDASLEDMTANKHTILIFSIKDLEPQSLQYMMSLSRSGHERRMSPPLMTEIC